MTDTLLGVVAFVAGMLLLLYCIPRGGRAKPIMDRPVVGYLIPVVIMGALVVGVILILAGIGVLT